MAAGSSKWYTATVTNRDYVLKVFECQLEAALKNIELLAATVGNRVQVAFVSGTDFGTQTGQFCSVKTYRELFKPFHKAVNDRIHNIPSNVPTENILVLFRAVKDGQRQ